MEGRKELIYMRGRGWLGGGGVKRPGYSAMGECWHIRLGLLKGKGELEMPGFLAKRNVHNRKLLS